MKIEKCGAVFCFSIVFLMGIGSSYGDTFEPDYSGRSAKGSVYVSGNYAQANLNVRYNPDYLHEESFVVVKTDLSTSYSSGYIYIWDGYRKRAFYCYGVFGSSGGPYWEIKALADTASDGTRFAVQKDANGYCKNLSLEKSSMSMH